MARRKKPSRNRFVCWKTVNGQKMYVANGTATGFSATKARVRLLRGAAANDMKSLYGLSCRVAKFSKTGSLLGGAHSRRRKARR